MYMYKHIAYYLMCQFFQNGKKIHRCKHSNFKAHLPTLSTTHAFPVQ